MPYLTCPECQLVLNGRYAFGLDSCPRCLARGARRVTLDATLGPFRRPGRFQTGPVERAVAGTGRDVLGSPPGPAG
jgi:Zn-finger nucleic acid-binding protein